MSIPTTLTPEQAQELTELLVLARTQLRDAIGDCLYWPNYALTVVRINDALRAFDIELEDFFLGRSEWPHKPS